MVPTVTSYLLAPNGASRKGNGPNALVDDTSRLSLMILQIKESARRLTKVQSTPSKTDTFGTGSKCPSKRDVRLIESQIKGVKKGRDQL